MTTPSNENAKHQSDAANNAAIAIRADFRAVFTSDPGKRVLRFIQSTARCVPGNQRPSFLPTAGGGFIDPVAAAFADGRKSLYYELESIIHIPEDAEEARPPQAIGKRSRRKNTGSA